VQPPEPAYDICHRTGDQEVFLDEAQALTGPCGIVGVQHAGEVLGGDLVVDRADEIAGAEFVQVEEVGRACSPQPQGIDGFAAVADDWPVVGHANQRRGPARYNAEGTVTNVE
jgi:hypothetical protein